MGITLTTRDKLGLEKQITVPRDAWLRPMYYVTEQGELRENPEYKVKDFCSPAVFNSYLKNFYPEVWEIYRNRA